MTRTSGQVSPSRDPETVGADADREALKRVLASESRSALARIELAASDLARFETSPALQARVAAIRSAVEEIDGHLSKIDLLSTGIASEHKESSDLIAIASGVFGRLTPGLAARGVAIDFRVVPDTDGTPRELVVPVPPTSLEALLVTTLRIIVSAMESAMESAEERPATSLADSRSASRFSVAAELEACGDSVWLTLVPFVTSTTGSLVASSKRLARLTPVVGKVSGVKRSMLLDLEVELAELGGTLAELPSTKFFGLGWNLPIARREAGDGTREDV